MATLEELQQQLATLKERYSEVIEGSYSYEESIATIAVNMQAQLDDAQTAASSAGTYATLAENAADEAAVAGAEAGATAGASAAQTKYNDIFTRDHYWDSFQDFYSIQSASVNADALWARKVDVYSLNADKLALRYSIEDMFYNVSFTSDLHNNGNVKVQLTDSAGRFVWLQCYSADCSFVAAHSSVRAPLVDTYNLQIHDHQNWDKSVQLEADTDTTVGDIDFVLNATPNTGDGHVMLSAYSASFKYINADDAINAYDVLARNRFILGGHLAYGGDSGPTYDGLSVVLEQSYDSGHNHGVMALYGKNFYDGGSVYDVYLAAYSADFKYLAAENAISVDGVSINRTELQQLKDLASASAPTDYYADSYFENLWAAKRTDDIYIRRIYKFAYNQDPTMMQLWDSCPPTVALKLKDGSVHTYTNALFRAFKDGGQSNPVCSPATDVTPGYDPIKDLLVGFWERCNYYKDSNGDVRITAVNGDGAFDKRKADVGTFGPTLWFDIRDSLEMDSTNTTPMYTEIIVSTAPHPELGLNPHPLSMRSDGTVAPYWCCSAYPAGAKDYELVSAYGSNLTLNKKTLDESYTGSYSDGTLSSADLITYCQNKGQGYGGGVYINFLVQLMFLLKYGTKNSQSIFKGICAYDPNVYCYMEVTNAITKGALGYNPERGARWLPLEGTEAMYSFFLHSRALTVSITGDVTGDNGLPDNDTPLPVLDVEPVDVAGTQYYKVFLETDYSIRLDAGNVITLNNQIPPAGTTDRVLSKYDGVSGYSAWTTLKTNAAPAGYSNLPFADTIFEEPTYPFRIHGIEYGIHGEIFMDKIYVQSGSDYGTIGGYYRLPWETKVATAVNNYSIKERASYEGAFGTDYIAACIAPTSKTGYDYSIVVGLPTATSETSHASSQTGLCDLCNIINRSIGTPSFAAGCGSAAVYSIVEAGLFYVDEQPVNNKLYPLYAGAGVSVYSGIRL